MHKEGNKHTCFFFTHAETYLMFHKRRLNRNLEWDYSVNIFKGAGVAEILFGGAEDGNCENVILYTNSAYYPSIL